MRLRRELHETEIDHSETETKFCLQTTFVSRPWHSCILLIMIDHVCCLLFSCIISACMLYYCNTVRLDWGLSGWPTTLLQCFDTVGWVIRPVKTVGRITYIVSVQTLNHAQSISQCLWWTLTRWDCINNRGVYLDQVNAQNLIKCSWQFAADDSCG